MVLILLLRRTLLRKVTICPLKYRQKFPTPESGTFSNRVSRNALLENKEETMRRLFARAILCLICKEF